MWHVLQKEMTNYCNNHNLLILDIFEYEDVSRNEGRNHPKIKKKKTKCSSLDKATEERASKINELRKRYYVTLMKIVTSSSLNNVGL